MFTINVWYERNAFLYLTIELNRYLFNKWTTGISLHDSPFGPYQMFLLHLFICAICVIQAIIFRSVHAQTCISEAGTRAQTWFNVIWITGIGKKLKWNVILFYIFVLIFPVIFFLSLLSYTALRTLTFNNNKIFKSKKKIKKWI